MDSNIAQLLGRNRAFAASAARQAAPSLPFLPHKRLYILRAWIAASIRPSSSASTSARRWSSGISAGGSPLK